MTTATTHAPGRADTCNTRPAVSWKRTGPTSATLTQGVVTAWITQTHAMGTGEALFELRVAPWFDGEPARYVCARPDLKEVMATAEYFARRITEAEKEAAS
ncbi:hypothetical protein SAMN05444149_101917 [Pseudosulfitobacter pseudonitzschiae]|uniref:Uncharacterized protein n=1 Tax=Pseudosulfitobacter pseudonitzschiae TaxID=1402135 RepID=A0A073J6H4_9RHOB|nr:hypothetical protein [Pseudosulfitobacter pseudonitzschiae]KEJ97405.1 hypothetical protein SUH3_00025 [Pseudosulfitobacter pseudonitzschiae]QKS08697.1 hypothetical protein HT745_09515 [Pseudosulfitobacter pseudonitzschiae]SHE72068.1 hypothetical protein SAMN05444149_101917 [Pseudosulfitobacter pseudonitzschiae]